MPLTVGLDGLRGEFQTDLGIYEQKDAILSASVLLEPGHPVHLHCVANPDRPPFADTVVYSCHLQVLLASPQLPEHIRPVPISTSHICHKPASGELTDQLQRLI